MRKWNANDGKWQNPVKQKRFEIENASPPDRTAEGSSRQTAAVFVIFDFGWSVLVQQTADNRQHTANFGLVNSRQQQFFVSFVWFWFSRQQMNSNQQEPAVASRQWERMAANEG
jgi:hypothetical protein